MIKILLVCSEDANAFQNYINEAIRNKRIVDIKYQAMLVPKEYTYGVLSKSTIVDRAMIIYEE